LTALNTYTTAATPSAVSVTPTTITAGTTQYKFKNSWSFNGTPNGAWTAAAQAVAGATGTYTANFDTYYQVIVTTSGGCSVQSPIGYYLAGSTQPINVQVPPGISLTGINWISGNGPPQPVTNGTFIVTGPGTVAVTCGPNPQVIVNTSPTPIGATVGINSLGTGVNQFSASVAQGAYTLTANSPVTTPAIRYQFKEWRQGSSVLGTLSSGQPVTVSGAVTYTAFYDVQAYKFTLVNNGCQGVGATIGLPADGYVPVGSVVSGFFATPLAGQVFTGAVLTATGGTGTPSQPVTNLAGMSIPSAVATTITFTCKAP
jgi:hypothetical protein